MNIEDVKEGLKAGKLFRRVEKLPNGQEETQILSPQGFRNADGEYTSFKDYTRTTLNNENGSCGGSMVLDISRLPGRFDAEGWEENTKPPRKVTTHLTHS